MFTRALSWLALAFTLFTGACGVAPGRPVSSESSTAPSGPVGCGDGFSHGQVRWELRYEEASVTAPDTCRSEKLKRTCLDGEIVDSGTTLQLTACEVFSPAGCGEGFAHGEVRTELRYRNASVHAPAICVSERLERRCSHGKIEDRGTQFTHTECEIIASQNCGAGFAHGDVRSELRYREASATAPATCVSETLQRSCDNGVIEESGTTFTETACVVKVPKGCGDGFADGEVRSELRYRESQVAAPGVCVSETLERTCKDGLIHESGTQLTHTDCEVVVPPDCGSGFRHGQVRTELRYQAESVIAPASCVSEKLERACDNGKILESGTTFTFTTCEMLTPSGCGVGFEHGQTRDELRFESASVLGPESCVSQVLHRSCDNGVITDTGTDLTITACEVVPPVGCGSELPNDGDYVFEPRYRMPTAVPPERCEPEGLVRRCRNGTIIEEGTTFEYLSCEELPPPGCDDPAIPNHGDREWVERFDTSTVVAPAVCQSRWGYFRQCAFGEIEEFGEPECIVLDCEIGAQETRDAYAQRLVGPGQGCSSEEQTRTCSDDHTWGPWSGGFTADACKELEGDPVATGEAQHACTVFEDGSLWCWGELPWTASGAESAAGDDPTLRALARLRGQRVLSEERWLAVDVHSSETCAIRENGTLWCWGKDLQPRRVGEAKDWQAIAIKSSEPTTGCGLKTSGALHCWEDAANEVSLSAGPFVRVVAAGSYVCALKADATVECIGDVPVGAGAANTVTLEALTQVSIAPLEDSSDSSPAAAIVDIAAGPTHLAALDELGSVLYLGSSLYEAAPREGVAAGDSLGVVLVAHETAYSPFSQVPTGGLRSIAVGRDQTCAIDTNGGLWCWGRSASGHLPLRWQNGRRPTKVGEAEGWAGVSAGDLGCAWKDSQTVSCWSAGLETPQDQAVPIRVSLDKKWRDAYAGNNRVCARSEESDLYCWGSGAYGPSGSKPTNVPLSVGRGIKEGYTVGYHGWCAEAAAQGVICGGGWDLGAPLGGRGWGQLSRAKGQSSRFACGINPAGSIECWGDDNRGQLGSDNTYLLDHTDWSRVTVGHDHSCALRGGEVWCWGAGDRGQLDTETRQDSGYPVQIGAADDWLTVSAGQNGACGIRGSQPGEQRGSLWCWGEHSGSWSARSLTQIGTDDDWEAVANGDRHVCAIKSDGSLWCWGSGYQGQLGILGVDGYRDAPGLVDQGPWLPQGLALGRESSCGIKADHTMWCWGSNSAGQLGNGIGLGEVSIQP